MSKKRKNMPVDVRRFVLHGAGYKCGNPACRGIITLDVHHLEYVSEGGGDGAENLLPLCPQCHALHHAGHIPTESLRAWKMILLALNEAFDRTSTDILLTLDKMKLLYLTAEGLISLAPLIASDMVEVEAPKWVPKFLVKLSAKGRSFVQHWKQGDQRQAVEYLASANPESR